VGDAARKLRVQLVDGRPERLAEVTRTVTSLGHVVVGAGADHAAVGRVTLSELPDVALVIVGENSEEAFGLIRTIVREAACPVIAILDVQDRAFIDKAARLGIFSYIAHGGDVEEMQSSIDIALERFAEYHALEGAFGRRAITERAKGILMERHGIGETASVPAAARPCPKHQSEDRRRRRVRRGESPPVAERQRTRACGRGDLRY